MSSSVYAPAEIDHDWVWYGHLFESHSWFIDTQNDRVLHTANHTPEPECITLTTAPRVTPASPQVTAPETNVVELGSIADVAGSIELGELVPLPTGSTVGVNNGVLSVAEDAVTYTPIEIPDGSPLLNKYHSDVSTLHPRDRPDISLSTGLGSASVTFLNPTAVSPVGYSGRTSSESTSLTTS